MLCSEDTKSIPMARENLGIKWREVFKTKIIMMKRVIDKPMRLKDDRFPGSDIGMLSS